MSNFIFGNSEESKNINQDYNSKKSTRRNTKVDIVKYDNIELTWEMPAKSVEGFLIHYNIEGNEKVTEIKVYSDDLKGVEDPKYGYVYKYTLKNIPSDKIIKVAISAFSNEVISPPSTTIVVEPSVSLG